MAVTGAEPISAANLKAVVDELKSQLGGGVVLYSNPDGQTTANLSEPIDGYSFLEITVCESSTFHTACVPAKVDSNLWFSGIRGVKINRQSVYFSNNRVLRVVGYK